MAAWAATAGASSASALCSSARSWRRAGLPRGSRLPGRSEPAAGPRQDALALRLDFRCAFRPVGLEAGVLELGVADNVGVVDEEIIPRTRLKELLLRRQPDR